MAGVDTLCKTLEDPDLEDNHLRFICEHFDDNKEFELDDPTEDFDNYDKREGRKDKVSKFTKDDDFEDELETS